VVSKTELVGVTAFAVGAVMSAVAAVGHLVRGDGSAAVGFGLASVYAGLLVACEVELIRARLAAASVDPGATSLVMVGGVLDGAEVPMACPCGCGGGLPDVPDRIVVGGSVYERDGVAHTAYRMTAVPGGEER